MELKFIMMILSYNALGIIDEKFVDYFIKYNDVRNMSMQEVIKIIGLEFDMYVKGTV